VCPRSRACFSDDVLTARSFARRDEVIAANRELLALGVANAGSSLLQGFPVSSSASRTAIAVTTGSRTQLYSVIAAVAVVAVLLFARPVLAQFPVAALGAIVIYAAIRLIDVTAFRRLLAFRRTELAIALATCAGVLVFNILYGVLVAIGLSVADLLVRAARPHDAVLGRVSGLAGMHDVDDYPGAQTIPGLVVYRYDAPLFFANADYFRRRALAAASQEPGPPRWFVLNVEATSNPGSGLLTIRPDGHVGLRCQRAEPDQLTAWLNLIRVPRPEADPRAAWPPVRAPLPAQLTGRPVPPRQQRISPPLLLRGGEIEFGVTRPCPVRARAAGSRWVRRSGRCAPGKP